LKHLPRYYQQEAVDAIFNYFEKDDCGHPIIELPTAAGKSLLQAMIAERILKEYPECRILFLTHQQELIKQNFNELISNLGLVDAGIYSSGLKCRDTGNKIIFAGIQSVYKKALNLGCFNLVVIDECFTEETLISTPTGEKKIKDIRCGDVVYNATGTGVIKTISKRKSKKTYKVELSNGKNFICTGEHPIFTDNGWIKTRNLEKGQDLYSRKRMQKMWKDFLSMDKNKRWKNKIIFQGKSMERSRMLLSILCEEIEKSDVQPRIKKQNEGIIKKDRAQANNQGREWTFDYPTNYIIVYALRRMGCRIGNTNWMQTVRKIIPNLLQNRYSKSDSKNRNRSRWENSLWRTIKKGFEKIGIIENIRVVNISYKECGDNEFVYNLQVSNHPSYYAAGVLVHNCHLIPAKGFGTYRKFLDDMLKQAPYCKIIGLSATPYRLDSGLLTSGDDKIFDEIIYRVPLSKLIQEGYLCELIGKTGIIKPDVTGVKKRGGEYIESDLNKVCDDDNIIKKAVTEFIELTHDRNHVLIFCVGISHAHHVKEEMERQGVECEVVHSKISPKEKDRIISGFKDGSIRYLANCDMLTTGFNASLIDCIIMLRPTESTGLYYQIGGRGLRTHKDKKNCLILDYAGNILRHGPIDKIEIETKGLSSNMGVKTAPMKECPKCKIPLPIQTAKCKECGFIWPVNITHDSEASSADPLSKYIPPREIVLLPDDIRYYVHQKEDRLSMRVEYKTGVIDHVAEWVCIEHDGFARAKAVQWLKTALPLGYPVPDSVEECMEMADIFKKPASIFVDFNQKFPKIISKIYPEEYEETESMNIINKNFVR
jgi:DNA repair protein RadD